MTTTEDNPFPSAIYQPEMVQVIKDDLTDVIEICEENTRELIAEHLRSLGETTTKNRLTANLYRSQLAKCEQLKKSFTP